MMPCLTSANQAGSWRDVRHLQVLVWMVIGLIQEGSIHLSAWIDHVDSRAVFAQSTQRRFSRWLHNGRIQVYRAYAPLIRRLFCDWQDSVVYVALDTTMLWDTYCVIRLSLVYPWTSDSTRLASATPRSSAVLLSDVTAACCNALQHCCPTMWRWCCWATEALLMHH